MEKWILISLLPPLIFSITNYLDMYILNKYKIDSRAMPVYVGIGAFLTYLFCLFILDVGAFWEGDAPYFFFSGLAIMGGIYFYFRALQTGKVIVLTVLFQMIPFFALLGGYLIFDEIPTTKQIVGCIFIVTAALGISIKKSEKFTWDKAFFFMLAADILFCSSSFIVKGLSQNPLKVIVCYEALGVVAGGIFVFCLLTESRKAFFDNIQKSPRVFSFVLSNEILGNLARTLVIYAISLGPIALILTLQSVQVFYALIIGWILTLFVPTFFKEDMDRRSIIKSILFSILMFGGVYLIQM